MRYADVFEEDLCFVSFSFKSKENLQRCEDFFFDILITSKVASALAMF